MIASSQGQSVVSEEGNGYLCRGKNKGCSIAPALPGRKVRAAQGAAPREKRGLTLGD
jgi:hypothetical protein